MLQNRWDALVRYQVAAGVISNDQVIRSQDVERAAELVIQLPELVQSISREIMSQSIRYIWLVLCYSSPS